jgi:pyruvate-formate lyase-activating enzyme
MSKLGWIKFGFEEMKFLKSFKDFEILYDKKLPFLIPRLTSSRMADAVPPSLQLEPTNYCNLNCICCPRERMGREKGFMDFGLFRKVIDDASRIGVKRVHLYLHGEPMLHPRIVEMIGYIKSKGLGFNMATNGMFLDKGKTEAILRSGVNSADYIMFSMLGYSKEVHEKIMRYVNHERVIKNLTDLLQLRRKLKINGPVVEAVFYRMPENEGEDGQFIKKWSGVADHVKAVGKISRSFADFKMRETSALRNKTCSLLWERMTVCWNGDTVLCALDVDGHHVLGNLEGESISDIWSCEALLTIKKLHRQNNFKGLRLCSSCDE